MRSHQRVTRGRDVRAELQASSLFLFDRCDKIHRLSQFQCAGNVSAGIRSLVGGGGLGGPNPDPPSVNLHQIELCSTSNRRSTVASRRSLLPRCLKPFVAAGDEHTVTVDTDSCQTPAQTRPQPSDVAATRASHHWSAEEADFCPPAMKQVNVTGSLDERKHQNADSSKTVKE